MKVIFILAAVFIFNQFFSSQTEPEAITICHTPNDMAEMAADPKFQKLHASPDVFHYQGEGEMVSFATPDGKKASGFLLKSPKKSEK